MYATCIVTWFSAITPLTFIRRVKPGEEIEIVGLRKTIKTTVTGVEMFHKLLDSGEVSAHAEFQL